jgi:ADP-heptose:LPS heptosyltransferase
VLLARCAARFVLHGSSRRAIKSPKSVAVVQFGKLGDMVCTTPMFRAIKKADPNTRVIVVGDKVGGQVLAGNPDVDRYIICGKDIGQALQELRKEEVQAGITAGPSMRAFCLLYLSGAPLVVAPRIMGEKSSEGRLYRLVRRLGVLKPHAIGSYAPREYLRLLEPLGIADEDTKKRVACAPEAASRIQALLEKHGAHGAFLAGISASAGNKIKNWPADRFAAVADHVAERYGATIVFIGGPGDRPETDAARARLAEGTRCIDTVGELSVEELKALVARLGIFIAVDTGPIYIAEALGVPTVDIVGPMDEREQPPIGERHAVVVPPFERKPQLFIMSPGKYDWDEARRQAEGISVRQVVAAVDGLMARIR